jgi:hypothetical protein
VCVNAWNEFAPVFKQELFIFQSLAQKLSTLWQSKRRFRKVFCPKSPYARGKTDVGIHLALEGSNSASQFAKLEKSISATQGRITNKKRQGIQFAGLRAVSILSIVAGFIGSGICHEAAGPQIEANLGVLIFDRTLSFDASPSLGLGVGHGITNFLQLNLAFLFSPTQQTISTAVSKLETKVYVFKYLISFRATTPGQIAGRLRPFLNAGVGGEWLDPHSATIDLGGGNVIRTNPRIDHKVVFAFGAGSTISLTNRVGLKLEWRNDLYRLDRVLDDGVTTKPFLARDTFLGAGLVVTF